MSAALAILLTACASDEGGSETESETSSGDTGASTEAAEAAADEGGEPVTLSFQSLAWQEQSIAANQAIIEAWNSEHPDIQVEYVQGDWGSVHDQLLTSFEGGSPPDVIHYEAAGVQVFAEGGYLADLEGLLSEEFMSGIPDDVWATVQYDEHGTIGVPFLVESRLPLANRTMLEDAGVRVPTPDDPWTWDEFQEAATQLTTDDTHGVAFPLGSPANAMVTLSPAFGASWVDEAGGDPTLAVDPGAELAIPQRIHEMLYEDGSADPSMVSSSTTDSLPGFFAGEYAMVFGAIWLRQQMVEQAPEDFDWVTIPPLEGSDGSTQAVNPQIISVAEQSPHHEEAAQFIEYFLAAENMAELALGDWLVPTSEGALEAVREQTEGEQGWDVAVASASSLSATSWQGTAGFDEWLSRVATPAFQRYFADEGSLEDLEAALESSDVRLGG